MIIGVMQGRIVKREIKSKMQSFPWRYWEKEFYLANKLSIKVLEWTIDYKNFFKNPINTEKGIKKIIKLKKKYSVRIESITCDFFMQKPFFKNKKKNASEHMMRKIIFLVNQCKILGIKYIVIPLVDNSSLNGKIEENKVIIFFNKIEKILQKNKVKILFEIDYQPKKIKNFLTKFDQNLFGINYDSGNSTALNYKFQNEMINFKYIKNIHLKDRKVNGVSKRFGEGDTNFSQIFSFLKKKKYKGNLILQSYHPIKFSLKKDLVHNLNYIRNKIDEKNYY
jgi:L-ribulose-5-phosphate 3-epimerase